MAEAIAVSGANSILCPTTGEVCPARENLVRLFDNHVDAKYAEGLPRENQPQFDAIKLQTRLAEYSVRAQMSGCGGPNEAACPIRESMDESMVRVGIVGALRKALRRVK